MSQKSISHFITSAIAMLGMCTIPLQVNAQASSDTIKLIVITAAGGAADQAARIVAEKLAPTINKTWGRWKHCIQVCGEFQAGWPHIFNDVE